MSFEQTFAFSASCSFMNLDSVATTITISCGGSLRFFLKTTHIAVFLGSSIMTQELNLVMEIS
jgi:hypothetical protein